MGSRRSQQDHVRSLLKDAIMALCKRGLDSMACFSVEALIGITLEDGDVMLVSINEKMDGHKDFGDTRVGAALNRVLGSAFDDEDEDPTPNWSSSGGGKRRIFNAKSKFFSKSKRKRGRPRKLTAAIVRPSKEQKPSARDGEEDADPVPEEYKDKGHENIALKMEVIATGEGEEAGAEQAEGVIKPDDSGDQQTMQSDEPSNATRPPIAEGQGVECLLGGTSNIPQSGPYKCSECSAVYKYRKCLIEHQLKQHQPKDPGPAVQQSFPCDSCQKVFSTKRSLTRHVVVHSPDRERFPCEICKKSFSCQRHVEFHIRTIHEGMYPFMCELCGKHATTKNSLAGHMASKHSVDKIHCSKCDRDYASHATFIRHICVERQPKFDETVCHVCNKTFDVPKRLIQHMAKHLEPSHQCDRCGKSFKWVSSLQAHKIAAHKDIIPTRQQQTDGQLEQPAVEQLHMQSSDTQESKVQLEHGSLSERMNTSEEQRVETVAVLPGPSYNHMGGSDRPSIYYTVPYTGIPHAVQPTAEIIPAAEWQGQPTSSFTYTNLSNNPSSNL